MKEAEHYTESVSFFCPFCGQMVSTGYVKRIDEDVPTVLHAMPPCVQYEEQEPDVFLENARKKMQGTIS